MSAGTSRSSSFRLLSLGDSYTIGEAVAENERWPMQLAAMLRSRGFDPTSPTIIARTGWTTDELASAIDAAQPAGPYDVVTLLVGVNDQYRGRALDDYRGRFRSLLGRAIELAGGREGRVVVLSIPDWSVTPFAAASDRARIADEIDRYNAINSAETTRARARYVDVTPISRRAASDPSLIAGDGLHPSAAMYGAWARLLLPVVEGVLQRNG